MVDGPNNTGAVVKKDTVRILAEALLRKAMEAMGAATERMVARLKTDAQFRRFIFTQPVNLGADVDPRMVTMFDQSIRGAVFTAMDATLKECAELEIPWGDENLGADDVKGWHAGIEAYRAAIHARGSPQAEAEPEASG